MWSFLYVGAFDLNLTAAASSFNHRGQRGMLCIDLSKGFLKGSVGKGQALDRARRKPA